MTNLIQTNWLIRNIAKYIITGCKYATGLHGIWTSVIRLSIWLLTWYRNLLRQHTFFYFSNTDFYPPGFAASSSYPTVGGGVNYQCLSLSPQFDNTGGGGDLYAFISGAEYQTAGSGALTNVHDHNVPCARCHSGRSAIMMLPGRRDCLAGWTKEYNGW